MNISSSLTSGAAAKPTTTRAGRGGPVANRSFDRSGGLWGRRQPLARVLVFQSLWKSRDHCGQLCHRWPDAWAGSGGGGGGLEGKTLLDVCRLCAFLRSGRPLHAGRSRTLPVDWEIECAVPDLRSPDAGEAENGRRLITSGFPASQIPKVSRFKYALDILGSVNHSNHINSVREWPVEN